MPYQEPACFNGARGFQKEERMSDMTTWLSSNDENWWKCGKGEDSCENRSLLRHQKDSRRVEYGQTSTKTDFNNKFEHERSMPKWPQRIHQFLDVKQIQMLKHSLYSPDLAPLWLFSFSQNCEGHSEEPIFSQLKTSIRKQQSCLKHFHSMTSGDALRLGRLVWGSV